MLPRAARTLVLVALLAPFAAAADATFTVTTTADAGAGSLRQAMLDANATSGTDTIAFAIPAELCGANGVCRIEPSTALPTITETVTIDATTQPRFGTAPANVCATQTAPSFMRVEVVTGATITNGFEITEGTAAPVVLRGLSVHAATRGIYVRAAGAHRIQCNHVNVSGPGDALLPPATVGVALSVQSEGAIVGTDGDGTGDQAERNVFGGTTWGVYVNANDDASIAGNYFCVGADGATPLGGDMIGVLLRDASSNNLVGTDEDLVSDELEGNLFGACLLGVSVTIETGGTPTGNVVAGNRIGIDGAGNAVGVLAVEAASLGIWNNLFTANDVAIQMIGASTLAASSDQNCIEGNTVGFEQLDGSTALVFENNWWGDASGPSGIGPGSGDAIDVSGTGSVDFEPFLTALPEHCVVPEPGAVALSASALLAVAGLRKARRA